MTYGSNAQVRSTRSPVPLLVCVAILLICRIVFTPAKQNPVLQSVASGGTENIAEIQQFHGRLCLHDCSGVEAGHKWADHNHISNVYDCNGDTEAFLEGCRIFVEEQSAAPSGR